MWLAPPPDCHMMLLARSQEVEKSMNKKINPPKKKGDSTVMANELSLTSDAKSPGDDIELELWQL